MKISTQLLFGRAAEQMSLVQNKMADTQAQLSQGKQLIKPSDAPDQAAVIQRMKSVMSRQESFHTSLATLNSRLQNEDTTLKSATNLLVRAKEIAVQNPLAKGNSFQAQAAGDADLMEHFKSKERFY